ncbi:uncharacterized protein si:ch211-214p13.7 [Esox lucius]|uniref:uncharacterized protein si:ch211-214p13.7 n=1 Tax=Esox lucius TaxID=8010 RepID=UPI00147751B5|nr:uncharacterized protein si:ch211-214p13.7 [Esox lucius]
MGNCSCGKQRKKTNEDGNDSDDPRDPETDKKEEDLTYATIDHVNTQTARVIVDSSNSDCDYAVINLPADPGLQSPIKEDCTDDYVLMG